MNSLPTDSCGPVKVIKTFINAFPEGQTVAWVFLIASVALLIRFWIRHEPAYVESYEERHHNHGVWGMRIIFGFILACIGWVAYEGWLREPIQQFCQSLL